MQKNLHVVFMFYMMMALLVGCKQAEEINTENEKLRITIEASIGKDGVVTGRTALGDEGIVSFADNDKIGLSVNEGDFVEWTYDGEENSWEQNKDVATLYWDGKGYHTFYAFYPYVDNATLTNVPTPNLTKQQGKKEELGIYDFLVTTKEQEYGEYGVVSFLGDYAFEHVSALISIELKGEGDLLSTMNNKVTLSNISIVGKNIVTNYNYSFTNSEVVVPVSDEDEGIDVLNVSANNMELTEEGFTYYFVVNAETVNLEDVDLIIEYKSGNKDYIATLYGMHQEGSEITNFFAGKQYSYALKVTGGEIIVSGNEIDEWDEVINLDDIIINGVEQSKSES